MKRKPFNTKLGKEHHERIMRLLAEQRPIYAIAKILKCDRHVLADYIRSMPELSDSLGDREESFHDTVENEIRKKIVIEHNLAAMTWYADRKMRDRGYGEHVDNSTTFGLDGVVAFGKIDESELPPEVKEEEYHAEEESKQDA